MKQPDSSKPDPAAATPALITLTQCESLTAADALCTQLESAGIKTFMPDESLMQTVAWNVNTYGYIRVQVASEDLDAAKEVLASIRQQSDSEPSDDELHRMELPLSWAMKLFAFLLPAFICAGAFVYAVAKAGYTRQGCDRKANDLRQWFLTGAVFWLIAYIVFLAVHRSPSSW